MARDYVVNQFRPAVDLQIDYPRELNPQQLEAVTAPPGPALVIAGAGSGKTRTLVYRVAFLLEQGIPSDRMLLLTFTNKAAREMMGRVGELVGSGVPGLWGGTFHSIGARILRLHADRIGYQPDFTILDREDATELIKACVEDSGFKTKGNDFPKPDALAGVFSMAVNRQITVSALLETDYRALEEWRREIADLAARYIERKRAANGMDFDDLLSLWHKLLTDNPEILEHYQRRFQFILVDEYQDTNSLQADLINLLSQRHHNVMAVGDDAQSIYSWRGANYQNIHQFPSLHPATRVFKIETNYRSTPEILACANAVIAGNSQQYQKILQAHRDSGPLPIIANCENPLQQAAFVAQRIVQLHREGTPLSEMAVLYRSHFHVAEIQMELTRLKIPFFITSGIRFFEQAHIKDVISYLKLLANPRDEVAFKRMVLFLPGVGKKGADRLWQAFCMARSNPASKEGINLDPTRPPIASALARCKDLLPKRSAAEWAALTATVYELESPEMRKQPSKMVQKIMVSGYDAMIEKLYDNPRVRREEIGQLQDFATGFSDLDELLTSLALLTNAESESQDASDKPSDAVRLSTVHQAKGLEYEVVFVVMLCEGLFPSARSIEERDGLEEERRLFYVAVTRAKTVLHLTWPQMRVSRGSPEFRQQASQFLRALRFDMVDEVNLRSSYNSY